MIGINELYNRYIRKPISGYRGIVCEPIDDAMAKLNRLINDTLSYFSYTLVVKGEATVVYNGTKMVLQPRDMMVTTPGARVFTQEVSEDYFALCLMADEMTTYEITDIRFAVLTAYSPMLIHVQNKLHLCENEFDALKKWMEEITAYGASDDPLTKIRLTSLYSLFVCELMNIENPGNADINKYGRPSEIFMDFLKLLPNNYTKHHDIQFYADRLAVTTIYLSRIVKNHSGQTVKDYIDRLLLSKASALLKRSDISIANIAETLNFANPQSFCKFFVRNKGISPRKYRGNNDT